MTELQRRIGLLVVIMAAVTFNVVYNSVLFSFMQDEFQFDRDFGSWMSPNGILKSVVHIASVVLIAFFSVEPTKYLDRVEPKYRFLIAAGIFGVLQWWSVPLVHYIGFMEFESGSGLAYSWSSRWNF